MTDDQEQSYADLAASGGIFPEFYAAALPVAWLVEYVQSGKRVRAFYEDEDEALRAAKNVGDYFIDITEPARVTPLYTARGTFSSVNEGGR